MKRTWSLDDIVDERLHEVKREKGFANMNRTIEFLIDSYEKKDGGNNFNKVKINEMDKNIQMLMEMICWQCDKSDTIPSISVEKGYSIAYNKTKELVLENIERKTKAKRSGNYLI